MDGFSWGYQGHFDPLHENFGLADCGQNAAGSGAGNYSVGSIHIDYDQGDRDQPPAVRRPCYFDPRHRILVDKLLEKGVPGRAEGIAYVLPDGAFHYAKVDNGRFVHTDANRTLEPGMLVIETTLDRNFNAIAQRAAQPKKIDTKEGFVNYCLRTYGGNGRFFYCKYERWFAQEIALAPLHQP